MGSRLKTIFLLGVLSVLLIYVGSFFGRGGLIIALVFALILNLVSYYHGDKIALRMSRAQEVPAGEMPEVRSIVRELAARDGLPEPKLYLIPSDSPNAFATGRSPSRASVAVTQGIVDLLQPNELKGVLAHELSHVKNRDILIGTIAATVASAITFIANMLQWGALFGGLGGGDDSEGGALSYVGIILMAILMPLAAGLLQLAISRSREYLADESGARLCGNPLSLANALRKISNGVAAAPMRNVNPSTSHMYIVNPFSAKGMAALFSTHPPVEERIKRLENMVF